jgi:hypothetical protein
MEKMGHTFLQGASNAIIQVRGVREMRSSPSTITVSLAPFATIARKKANDKKRGGMEAVSSPEELPPLLTH